MNITAGLLPLAHIYVNASLLGLLATALQGVVPNDILLQRLTLLLSATGVVAVLNVGLTHFSNTIQGLYQIRITNYVQELIATKAASLDLAFFENAEFHNKLQNASGDASTRPLIAMQQLLDAVCSLTTIASLGIIIFLWHSWILFIIIVPALALLWLIINLAEKNVEMKIGRTETVRRAGYFKGVLLGYGTAKEVRLLGLGGFFLARLKDVWKEMYEQDRELAKKRLLSRGILAIISALNQPLIVGYSALQLLRHEITFRRFSLYTQIAFSLASRFRNLAVALGQLYENNLFVASIFDFLSLQPKIEAPRSDKSRKINTALPTIEFRQVSFRYPEMEPWILKDVSFILHPGEITALVGSNGAGKTTLVKLLAGLYEATSGEILLDGIDINTLGRDELRSHFSFIFQDFPIYNLSVYHNIGVGQVVEIENHEAIKSVARATGLDPIIEKLPHGYETLLARSFKRGHEFSSGQRQLVALSRAVLRNAPILVLDEPTSAMDVHHERRFFSRLLGTQRTNKNQSILFICHRLTAVRHAQRILVLNGGKLIEEGTHERLIAQGGEYARMFNLQLQMYHDSWPTEPQEIAHHRSDTTVGKFL